MSLGHNVLLDTSAVIDLGQISGEDVAAKVGCDLADLRPGISSITLAELAAGPHATADPAIRAVRQARLQWAESTFDPLPFDTDAARAYGVIYASVVALGRKPRGRLADLLIASVAAANSIAIPSLRSWPRIFADRETACNNGRGLGHQPRGAVAGRTPRRPAARRRRSHVESVLGRRCIRSRAMYARAFA